MVYNSAFPFGFNDGAVWAGRGLTYVVHGGGALRIGPLSIALDPIYFSAQNAPFALVDNGLTGARRFADAQQAASIDLPQRFGDSRYARFNLGESYVRVDVLGLAAGVSTASQWWGPAITSPLLLGNNAGGFPHAFIGSASPMNIGIGRLHTRFEIGRLDQSDYSPIGADSGSRMAAAAVVTFSPSGAEGLELGAARFFHRRWPRGGPTLADLAIPLQGFTSNNIDYSTKYDPSNPAYNPENQLVSLFSRWALPRDKFELYGEYLRNDRNYDVRDALLEPDHDAAFTLGFQKTYADSARRQLLAIRGEVTNAQFSNLALLRPQSWPYSHYPIAQGHTEMGQALGSYFVERGGGGATLGVDWYRPTGRFGVELMRIVRGVPSTVSLPIGPRDVMYVTSASADASWRRWQLFGRVSLIDELNRNFAGDVINLSLETGIRGTR
jgi:hypothetical protein